MPCIPGNISGKHIIIDVKVFLDVGWLRGSICHYGGSLTYRVLVFSSFSGQPGVFIQGGDVSLCVLLLYHASIARSL